MVKKNNQSTFYDVIDALNERGEALLLQLESSFVFEDFVAGTKKQNFVQKWSFLADCGTDFL